MRDEPLPETLGPASAASAPVVSELGGDDRLSRGGVALAVFQGGRDPYYILVVIFIFVPYVSATLVGDPVRGQELIARYAQYGGWIVMATAWLAPGLVSLGTRLTQSQQWGFATIILLLGLGLAGLAFVREDTQHRTTREPG